MTRLRELCRRCGVRLDRALIEMAWDRHPHCYREPDTDLTVAHTLHVLAEVCPDARIEKERPA